MLKKRQKSAFGHFRFGSLKFAVKGLTKKYDHFFSYFLGASCSRFFFAPDTLLILVCFYVNEKPELR
jgi:hypothetical protein